MGETSWETYRLYFNALAPQWDSVPVDPRRLEALLARIPLTAGQQVLDVGCGTGLVIPHLRRRVGPGVPLLALDLAVDMLGTARKKLGGAQPLYFMAACAECLPVAAGSCDAVVCYSALPHFRRPDLFLRDCARILKRGGLVAVAHLLSSRELAVLHANLDGPVSQDRLPTPSELTSYLRDAGLVETESVDEPGAYLLLLRKP